MQNERGKMLSQNMIRLKKRKAKAGKGKSNHGANRKNRLLTGGVMVTLLVPFE